MQCAQSMASSSRENFARGHDTMDAALGDAARLNGGSPPQGNGHHAGASGGRSVGEMWGAFGAVCATWRGHLVHDGLGRECWHGSPRRLVIGTAVATAANTSLLHSHHAAQHVHAAGERDVPCLRGREIDLYRLIQG
jgi:hypothetical protein